MAAASPINPSVLRWARDTAGLSREDVVRKLGRKTITVETVTAWENGEAQPTYAQLESLAYNVYRRPLAVFLFPEPPTEETPRQAFRTLPDAEVQSLSPRMRLLIRQAESMQANLDELYDGTNPAEHLVTRAVRYTPGASVDQLASQLRDALGVGLDEQLKWDTDEEAFKVWRSALEDHGIFVFKEAFKEGDISGFCLYDDTFPVIYVNNSTSYTRQIFTLLHELAHLLSGTGGIDTRSDAYIEALAGPARQIEVFCNRFAVRFLVPEGDFDQQLRRMSINTDSIRALAHRYSVSREVILRKLLDRKAVSQHYYDQLVEEWNEAARRKKGQGGDYYRTKGAYLGERYLEVAFRHFYQNRITASQLADYLGVKPKNIPGMEALLFPKAASA